MAEKTDASAFLLHTYACIPLSHAHVHDTYAYMLQVRTHAQKYILKLSRMGSVSSKVCVCVCVCVCVLILFRFSFYLVV